MGGKPITLLLRGGERQRGKKLESDGGTAERRRVRVWVLKAKVGRCLDCNAYVQYYITHRRSFAGFRQTNEYSAVVNTSTHSKIFHNKIPSPLMIMMPFNPSLNGKKPAFLLP
jgi:hypothetical protein